MIKSETGSVLIRGSASMLVSELSLAVKAVRDALSKEYGESVAAAVINRAVEASKAEGDLDENIQGLIHDTFVIMANADSNKNKAENPVSVLVPKESLHEEFSNIGLSSREENNGTL